MHHKTHAEPKLTVLEMSHTPECWQRRHGRFHRALCCFWYSEGTQMGSRSCLVELFLPWLPQCYCWSAGWAATWGRSVASGRNEDTIRLTPVRAHVIHPLPWQNCRKLQKHQHSWSSAAGSPALPCPERCHDAAQLPYTPSQWLQKLLPVKKEQRTINSCCKSYCMSKICNVTSLRW